MKSSPSSAAARNNNSNHPPLAHDEQGHPVAMPDGATWWAIKRHTTGRPKAILGPDRRPIRLPLDTTEEEIADTFGPGTYRFDALDEVGNHLDHVTTLEIGDDASDDEDDDEPARSPGARGRGGSTDLRFALETILQMARAQSDALRAVTEAQADWVKGLASAKALPRNAVCAPPLALPAPAEVDDDEEEEENEDEPPSSPWAEAAEGIIRGLSPAVAAYVSTLGPRNAAPTAPAAPDVRAAPTSAPNPMVHLSAIAERLHGEERRVLRRALQHPDAEDLTRELLARSVDDAVAFVRNMIARGGADHPAATEARPPGFMAHAAAISALLVPDDRAALLALLPKLDAERRAQLEAQLLAMTADAAAVWIRENLPALQAKVEQ